MKLSIFFFAFLIVTQPSFAQEQSVDKGGVVVSDTDKNFVQRWFYAVKNNFSRIKNDGNHDLYLTGYAYHDRWTYTAEKLKDLNEGAYGGGYGRSIVNENGNTEMLYLMSHLDSHKDVQVNLGYAWVKKFHLSESFKLGIGYTAFLVSRSDFAHHIPLPFALPLGTVDVGRVSLNGILIPKLNDGINNGNVLFLFLKINWDRNKDVI